MSASLNLRIEQATEKDVNLIREFIQALAKYEKLSHHFEATEDRLRNALFGSDPKAFVLLAYDADDPVGFAVYFYTFSTFTGLPGLYLEDLFVKPSTRGRGVGRALLRHLARIALQQNCWRIEWAVLHWNESAIRFYQNLGAVLMNEWSVYRLHGEHLTALANS